MRFMFALGMAMASVAMAKPVPEAEAGLADKLAAALPHPISGNDRKRDVAEKIARALENVGLSPFKHIMTSEEPVDLVTRQAPNNTSNAAAKGKGKKGKKGKGAGNAAKGKKGKKAKGKAAVVTSATAPAAEAAAI